ncbi:MAG: hypothetical protein ABIN25_04845 [Ginsengibacter sp.]
MRIVFICACVEPGRDGVGDYTIKLALQLIKSGHDACVIAIKDKYAKEYMEHTHRIEGVDLQIVRLQNLLSASERLREIKKIVNVFLPGWISLQYVPYAYHEKGMPVFLSGFLKKITNKSNWHIMIHEPYLSEQASFKNKTVRFFQILSLKLLKKNLQPHVFHTSISQYQKLLAEIRIESQLLGLFGNIPVPLNSKSGERLLHKGKRFTGVYFGAAPALLYHSVFSEKLSAFCDSCEEKVQIIICGRSGKNGKEFGEEISKALAPYGGTVDVRGEVEAASLSNLFSEADFGISRVPPIFIGKSGSAISMLEHGLPLWIPLQNQPDLNQYIDYRPGLCHYELSEIFDLKEKEKFDNRLPFIANTLIKDLIESDV